jgi:hypothetical protein
MFTRFFHDPPTHAINSGVERRLEKPPLHIESVAHTHLKVLTQSTFKETKRQSWKVLHKNLQVRTTEIGARSARGMLQSRH